MRPLVLLLFVLAVSCILLNPCCVTADEIDFNRDIRPLLADKCFHCHGPDPETREADLRLDLKQAAASVIEVGDSKNSQLFRRIVSNDDAEVMPPPDSGKQLTVDEIARLKLWIDQGAKWAQHWSFERPVKVALPTIKDISWSRNAIDHFVLARLGREGIRPSLMASKRTLARRVAFDLTGLPPTPEQLKRFLANDSDDSYEELVDELLASKHYGERMAMVWLDAARYADSDGYQADSTRQNWPWRDWVVDAYNANMPFDQFTIEQFAGDLLNDATQEQILATCFHRNHMHNGEGGRDAEESRIDYVRDRVNTMGTVWMGLTLECAQCHSHKYDPVSQSEYYSLNAFFNSIDENGKAGGGAGPFLKFKSPYVSAGLEDSVAWLKQKETELADVRRAELTHFDDWLRSRRRSIINPNAKFRSWRSFTASRLRSTSPTSLTQTEDVIQVAGNDPRHDDYLITVAPQLSRVTGLRLKVLPSPSTKGKLSRFEDGHIILTNLKVRVLSADGTREQTVDVKEAVADYQAAKGGRIYGPVATVLDDDPRTGWMTTGSDASQPKTAVFTFRKPVELHPQESLVIELRQRSLRGHSNLQRFSLEFTAEAMSATDGLKTTPLEQLAQLESAASEDISATKIPDKLRKQLESQFLADRPQFIAAQEAVTQAKRRKSSYDSAAKDQSVTVLKQREKPRETHILVRGVWNNKGDIVKPTTPSAIETGSTAPENRLALAKWLVNKEHPLTARVAVNRYWQMYFGYGLVRTPGDFGSQGERPTHPKLLDWLAVEFMESGWNVKQLQRLIVTSATYRQSSSVSTELLKRDPQNRLLARATRFRLPSWMIRDAALASSDLLDRRIGGPPVFPFQPEGAWLDATMGRFKYQTSVGGDRYRRSIYTFWRRSVGPTGMFDASKRRNCEVRSIRTNTPLQALTIMNDETFVDAAIQCAISSTGQDTVEKIAHVFEQITGREATEPEILILARQLHSHLDEFRESPNLAATFVSRHAERSENVKTEQTAAMAMIATTIMNLDETITHE